MKRMKTGAMMCIKDKSLFKEEKVNTLRSISHKKESALKVQIEGLQEVSAIEWISRYANKRVLKA